MLTPAHILREQAEAIPGLVEPLSDRDMDRREVILAKAARFLAQNAPHAVTFTLFSSTMRTSTQKMRRLFPTLDVVLAEILHAHLQSLFAAIGEVPRSDPDYCKKRRAIYVEKTHTGLGGHTPQQILLLRDRHTLPDDLGMHIEEARLQLARSLAEDLPHDVGLDVILLLDHPLYTAAQVERLLPAVVAVREEQMQSYAAPSETAEILEIPKAPQAVPFTQPQLSCRVLKYPTGPFERPYTELDAFFAAQGIHPREGPREERQVKEDVLF